MGIHGYARSTKLQKSIDDRLITNTAYTKRLVLVAESLYPNYRQNYTFNIIVLSD